MDKTRIADTLSGSPPADPAGSRPAWPPGCLPRRTAVAAGQAAGLPMASISRLGAGRWHIRWEPADENRRREVYLSPGDGGLISVTRTGNRLAIRLHGPLGDACVRNLGDCLVNALCEGVGHIDLWPGIQAFIPPDAGHMLESFGRNLARDHLCIGLDIHGFDPGANELAEAFRRGLAQAGKRNGAS
uniref:Uncharacterized protein n=1 Tax=Desulfovibrio sp. U5L TaxID=596152 RepID=I2Q6N3_9BACT